MSTQIEKPEFVLFMINQDQFCNTFINKVKTKPDLMKKINIVDIDRIPAIPDEVDEVPCIYDGKGVNKGANAFKWLTDIFSEYLDSAYDSINYSYLEGQEEQVFNTYSLLDQKNGSFGMGDSPAVGKNDDPTRMAVMNDNTNKNRSLESIIASRGLD